MKLGSNNIINTEEAVLEPQYSPRQIINVSMVTNGSIVFYVLTTQQNAYLCNYNAMIFTL